MQCDKLEHLSNLTPNGLLPSFALLFVAFVTFVRNQEHSYMNASEVIFILFALGLALDEVRHDSLSPPAALAILTYFLLP